MGLEPMTCRLQVEVTLICNTARETGGEDWQIKIGTDSYAFEVTVPCNAAKSKTNRRSADKNRLQSFQFSIIISKYL